MPPTPDITSERIASLRPLVEAAALASPEPMTVRELAKAFEASELEIQLVCDEISAQYARPQHGFFLRYTRGGYQIATKPELEEQIRKALWIARPPLPLSMAALQTLAIVAYQQPVSAPEIHAIRRVEAPGVLRTLLKRKLIAPAGHKPNGGALRYRTTHLFLTEFGLRDLKDLPALEQFGELSDRHLKSHSL